MSILGAILPGLIGAAGSAIGSIGQLRAGRDNLNAVGEQSDALSEAQQANVEQLNQYLDGLEPDAIVGETVGANLANKDGIRELGQFFAEAYKKIALNAGQEGVDFLTDNFLGTSRELGIDIPALTGLTQAESLRELEQGKARQEGRFFNDTAVGRQRVKEMFRTIAPRFTPQGLDTFAQNFAGSNSADEVDAVTEFFGVAQDESRYGDLQVGNALTRLGGVLDYARGTALPIADRGLQFGERTGSVASSIFQDQLLSPSDTINARNIQANSSLGLLRLNAQSAGGLFGAAQAAQAQQAGALQGLSGGISSGIGEIAKAIFTSRGGGSPTSGTLS